MNCRIAEVSKKETLNWYFAIHGPADCYPWAEGSHGIQHLEPSKNIPEWFYGNLCTPQITTIICRPFFGDDKELHVFTPQIPGCKMRVGVPGSSPTNVRYAWCGIGGAGGSFSERKKTWGLHIFTCLCVRISWIETWFFYQRYISMYIYIHTIYV